MLLTKKRNGLLSTICFCVSYFLSLTVKLWTATWVYNIAIGDVQLSPGTTSNYSIVFLTGLGKYIQQRLIIIAKVSAGISSNRWILLNSIFIVQQHRWWNILNIWIQWNAYIRSYGFTLFSKSISWKLKTESPLKMMKTAFYVTWKAFCVVKIFKFLFWFFGRVKKQLD